VIEGGGALAAPVEEALQMVMLPSGEQGMVVAGGPVEGLLQVTSGASCCS